MRPIALSKILKKEHQNKWIVFSPSLLKILAYHQELTKALEEARSIDCQDKTAMKVLPFDQVFIPTLLPPSQ